MSTKFCPKCKTTKEAGSFYRIVSRHDGLSSYCRSCQLADAKARHVPSQRWRPPEGMKYCSRCDTVKAIDAFGANRSNADGRQNYCKPCSVASVMRSRRKDPTSHRASSKRWSAANPERKADNEAKNRYGLEPGAYARMFQAQGGRCAICATDKPGARLRRFHIDHCHDTGKIRGLLCTRCNTGIGQFLHDPRKLEAAIAYLVSSNSAVT